MNAIPIVFPDSEHRYCKRHLLQNMGNKGWRGEKYKGFVDAAIYATTVWDYDKAMEDLKKLNLKAWEWLIAIGKEHFSRHAFSPKAKSDLVVNNLSEVFNKYILDARDKPIVTMVEHIRRKVMVRLSLKRQGGDAAQWEITPIVAGKLEMEKNHARYCWCYQSNLTTWEVHCLDRSFAVDISARTCACHKWQLTGIPCKHVVCALYKAGHTPEDYVADYFRKDAYMRTYTAVIYPVPDEHRWTKTDSPYIDPPKFDKHVGRPKKSRRRGPDEGPRVQGPARKTTSTCSNCRRDGHTCSNIKVSLTLSILRPIFI